MSGGGGYGPGAGGGSSGTPCEGLIFEAPLQSPKPAVIAKLNAGDTLEVVSKAKDGPVIVRHKTFGEAGSLVSRLPDLLRCIDSGTTYKAVILSIDGGQVRVRVSPT